MAELLDLTDIQGNVVKAYGHFSYINARYVFLRIDEANNARRFLTELAKKVTSGVYADPKRYSRIKKPDVTTNVAFTFAGLQAIELPHKSLMGFPQEFAAGMKKRQAILGDDGPSAPEHWDPIWKEDVHIWISINGLNEGFVEERYQWITQLIASTENGVTLLSGHRGSDNNEDMPYQSAAALIGDDGTPTGAEHFGFRDGIGDPVFVGQPNAHDRVLGRGKLTTGGRWAPLATGEFLLGHVDEALEYPIAPVPTMLARNGTFMVYRKLHENVGTFNQFLDAQAESFKGSREMLAAKFAGRWADNGAPVVNAPDDAAKAKWDEAYEKANPAQQRRMLTDFTYNDDIDGAKCPLSSHLRRINPRGSLEFGKKGAFTTPGALVDRRRILRRGLPYGKSKADSDNGEHGIIFMALNAAIERQFEFVQQQWVNYGNDFREGNDKEILLGNHDLNHPGKMVIQSKPGSDEPPHFVSNIPRFIETRGGDYFFIPSITALKMIAAGIIDPT